MEQSGDVQQPGPGGEWMGLDDPIANIKALREQIRQAGAYGAAERAREASLNPPAAEYAGFDARSGEAILKLPNGELVRGQPIFNSLIQPGDRVILDPATGRPFADQVSVSPQPPEIVEPEPAEVFGKLKILYYTPDGGLWIGGDRAVPKRIGQWDGSRQWSISNLGSGANRFVVSGVNRLLPVQVLRYGARGSIALVDESTAQQGLSSGMAGITRIFGNGGWLIGAGNWQQGGLPGLFPIVGQNQTKAWAWIMSATTIGDGYIDTDIYIEDVSRIETRVGNPAVVFYGQSVAVGGYNISSSKEVRTIQDPFAWYQEREEAGTVTGMIRIGGGIALTYSHSYAIPLWNDGGPPPNQILTSSSTIAPSLVFANTTDSSCIYSEFTQTTVNNSYTLPPTTKIWLQTGASRIELTALPLASARATMVGTTLYDPRNLSKAASTFTLRTLTAPTAAGTYSQAETPDTFHSIPTEATIIDWSYHP